MKLGRLDHSELLSEKTLWQIFLASQKIKDSKFNWILAIAVACLFMVYGFLEDDTLRIHVLLLKMADLGVNTSLTLLGFLIAGFTIFATLSRPQLLLLMLKNKHSITGLSYLKYNFFTLVRVFIYFLVFAAFELSILFLGQRDSIIAAFIKQWPDLESGLYWGNRILLVASAGLWTATFLQLKSFVFNINHFVMTMIKFDAVEYNDHLPQEDDLTTTETEES